ncbi:hypothetical protein LUW77_09425 [Streptomyces radiopugnans]|nr:hypothetical protein LUW77_09425 [Streptomyces radiopugnans]
MNPYDITNSTSVDATAGPWSSGGIRRCFNFSNFDKEDKMAGIRVVACLPAGAEENLEALLRDFLTPFEMYSGFEWREIWDRWTIRGGSDATGFLIVPGFEDDPRLIHDFPRYDGKILPSLPGRCAGGPKGMLRVSDSWDEWNSDLLTLDGWWIERGNPVHGACVSPELCPHMRDGWRYERNPLGYLENLDSNVILVKLLCHG